MVSFKLLSFYHNPTTHLADLILRKEFLIKLMMFKYTSIPKELEKFNELSEKAEKEWMAKLPSIHEVLPEMRDKVNSGEDLPMAEVYIKVPTFNFDEVLEYSLQNDIITIFALLERYLYNMTSSILKLYFNKSEKDVSFLLNDIRGPMRKRLDWIKALIGLENLPDRKKIRHIDELRKIRIEIKLFMVRNTHILVMTGSDIWKMSITFRENLMRSVFPSLLNCQDINNERLFITV